MGKMGKGSRGRPASKSRATPYHLPSPNLKSSKEEVNRKNPESKLSKAFPTEDYGDATCSICLEYPHNAVLLRCSSHNEGCRPYICATGFRYSNCLNRYTKACKYPPEMSCPLCRGRVKNWSVDEPARQIFNSRRRSCVGDECPFVGTYRELRKHTREVHLSMKPQEVDPLMEQKWKKMEQESDSLDALSVVWSSMSQPVVMGDYVIDIGSEDSDGGEDDFDSDEGDVAAPQESHA